MAVINWEENKVFLLNNDETTIYTNIEKTVIIKSLPKNIGICLYTEYVIGLEINKLYNPLFVNTLDFYETEDSYNLVLEYIHGVTLANYIDEHGYKSAIPILKNLINKLSTVQGHFTHYDLHFNNIIIDKSGNPVIIDYGQAYIDILDDSNDNTQNHEEDEDNEDNEDEEDNEDNEDNEDEQTYSCITIDRINYGRTPNIYDPLFDIITILQIFGFTINQNLHPKYGLSELDRNFIKYIMYDIDYILERTNSVLLESYQFGDEWDIDIISELNRLVKYVQNIPNITQDIVPLDPTNVLEQLKLIPNVEEYIYEQLAQDRRYNRINKSNVVLFLKGKDDDKDKNILLSNIYYEWYNQYMDQIVLLIYRYKLEIIKSRTIDLDELVDEINQIFDDILAV